jgi:organic radical activating enzyme
MKNQQRPRPPVQSDGRTLDVHSIFPTIQGEGPFAGCPAVFIRLLDCNLQCPLCDTEYTQNGLGALTVKQIVDEVAMRRVPGVSLAVITGGEPFRQNLSQLMEELLRVLGMHSQVETNGMLPIQAVDKIRGLVGEGFVSIVVSPKTHKLREEYGELASAFKYVVRAGDVDEDGLPIHALDHPVPKHERVARPPAAFRGDIFVQPADEKDFYSNQQNMAQAVKSALMLDRGRRRLCLQMHKYAELP